MTSVGDWSRMPVSETCVSSLDVEAIRKDFPILARQVHGLPLVYLDSGQHLAEAAPGARRDARALRAAQRQRRPRVHMLAAEATDGVRGRPRQGGRVHRRPGRDEVVFTKNASEALNLVAYAFPTPHLAPATARFRLGPGDEIVDHRDGAPLQHRAVAAAGRAHRRDAALVRHHRRRPARPVALDELITERTKVVSFVHQSNMLGTINPVARIVAPGPRRSARWCCSTPPRRCRTCRWTWPTLGVDFVGVHRAQDVRPDRHRRAVGPRELLDAMPPFLGGGEMIETVDDGPARPTRRCRTGSRPAPRRSPRRSGWARRWTTCRPRHGRRSRRTSSELTRVRAATRCATCPGCGSSARRPVDRGGDDLRSPSRASTRTTSARCSTSRASRCGSGTTAPGRSASGSACRRPPARRSTCTPRRRRSTRWSRARTRCGRSSAG